MGSDVEFPSSFRGDWLKHTERLGKEFVTIQEKNLIVPSSGDYTILSECQNHRKMLPNSKTKSYEYLMLSTYDNGCSPRVSTLNLAQHDNSALAFRVGQSQLASLSLSVDNDMRWVINNHM